MLAGSLRADVERENQIKMATEASSSESSFKRSSALVINELCSDDDSESEFTTFEPYDSDVDFSSISVSIVTAENLVSFLQTLSEGNISSTFSNDGVILTLALEAVLDESKSVLKEEFLQDVLRLVQACFTKAEVAKTQQKKEVIMERESGMTRSSSFYHYAIKQSWEKLIGYDVLSENTNFHHASEQLLQQILQHFWSLNCGSQFTGMESNYDGGESQCGTEEYLKYSDESDFDSIRDHGGWVIKQTRESILKGESDVRANDSVGGSEVVYGDKGDAMKIIATMGEDVKQQDGKFRFIIHENIVPFFVFLHNLVESLIDIRNLALEKGNILTSCLQKLSKNKELRDKWNGITSTTPNATSVFVLQNIVTFFVKSKQQIFREKRGLKPNKKSMAIRQQLKHSSNSTPKAKQISKEIVQLRSENLSTVHITNFMETLSTSSHSVQEKILGELTGQELSKVLKSLGKPSLLGKKKSRQIGLLLELLKNGNINTIL